MIIMVGVMNFYVLGVELIYFFRVDCCGALVALGWLIVIWNDGIVI